ncbi:transporter [Microbacterium sediminis]|uniref:Transporter n=1 Tax=Microbacterium sediminis TaxID=904291 RepID=A0A1B9N926_9MICO|nr:transporter [Microbacterium sediminis]OCG73087.1 transporter [Microbacterium sediminis]
MTQARTDSDYPGKDLGLPQSGSGSLASLGRRIGGLAIDWAAAYLLAATFFGSEALASHLTFMAIHIVFIPTIGGSPGHRILGMRLHRTTGGWVGVWPPILRTVLLGLVIPAAIWQDGRGLHDVIPGTVLVRA